MEAVTFKELYEQRYDKRLVSSLVFAINESYRLLDEFVRENPLLQYTSAKKSHGHLRNALVDVILKREVINKKLPIHYKEEEVTKNGYTYLLMEMKNILMTVHKTRSQHSVPRPAKNRLFRSYLNRQLSLFDEPPENDIENLPYYVMLTHGGKQLDKPDYIMLGAISPGCKDWIDQVDITNHLGVVHRLEKEEEEEIELDFNDTVKQILAKGVLKNGGAVQ